MSRHSAVVWAVLGGLGGLGIGSTMACGQDDAARPLSPTSRTVRLLYAPERANVVELSPTRARMVRLVIPASVESAVSLDELEVYAHPDGPNLALVTGGAIATASSTIEGYPIHQVAHLNDGHYGNDQSWVAGSTGLEWVQVELPTAQTINRIVVSRDRTGIYRDRLLGQFEVQVSLDGQNWSTVARVRTDDRPDFPEPLTWEGLLEYAYRCERRTWSMLSREDVLSPYQADRPALLGGPPYWKALAQLDPVARTLHQMRELADRLESRGVDVSVERLELARLSQLLERLLMGDADAEDCLFLDARDAKRRLFLRDPDLIAALSQVLFVKRHPYTPSHNYSDILDSVFIPGGGVCRLDIPERDGRLDPEGGEVTFLFDAALGIARDAVADVDGSTVYFAYRPGGSERSAESYWHLMAIPSTGGPAQQLTTGPFHDYYPCPLPDGRLAFISTRCRARFLCWRPQAFVLFSMDPAGGVESMRPLSYANLSEWAPSVRRDGQILWTRSEYLDKGADFGHTLWAIRPDGTHPTLVFGNNTRHCYVNAHEVPGTAEVVCTLISHGGDLNGPIGLIDTSRGPFASDAVTNITPDVTPRYHMDWATQECFRDPVPISRDLFLVSHAPGNRFGLYVIDRYGNRELLYLDPAIDSMAPTLLRPRPRSPVIASAPIAADTGEAVGELFLADVYEGLSPLVERGDIRYLRVCEEVRSDLQQEADGSFRDDHPPFEDYYASPTHRVSGPNGWPSYVAKSVVGVVPVETDGSARFLAPAGKVLYFQALDSNHNEIQRMRSVLQLQAGETRSCVGCHEDRTSAPPNREVYALQRPPSVPEPPSWGAGPFAYESVVQPVWNRHCTSCHNPGNPGGGLDLTGRLDAERVPASYRTLISGGWVHYFDYTWGREHEKAAPRSFGSLRSRLWEVLDASESHSDLGLGDDDRQRIKCWIDLNCPLWPDYTYRFGRPVEAATGTTP